MTTPPRRARPIRSLQELGLIVVILLLGALLTWRGKTVELTNPATGTTYTINTFLNAENLDKLAKNASFFAVMAVGVTLVIIVGGIDLSVGSIYAIAGVTTAKLLQYYGPSGAGAAQEGWWVVPVACSVCLGVGSLCGVINGVLTVWLKLHPFIITLGTMTILRNVAFLWTEGQSIGDFPQAFTDGFIRRQFIPGLYTVPMVIMLAVTLAGWVYLRYMVGGRLTFAVGGNETAARYSGVAVGRRKIVVYGLCGLTAGIAAMIGIGYYGSASSDDGKGYELQAIAAAVVGGASLAGGKGTALGALLGALLIKMIDNGIVVLEYPQQYSEIIMGAAIIGAAVLDRLMTRWSRRRMV